MATLRVRGAAYHHRQLRGAGAGGASAQRRQDHLSTEFGKLSTLYNIYIFYEQTVE